MTGRFWTTVGTRPNWDDVKIELKQEKVEKDKLFLLYSNVPIPELCNSCHVIKYIKYI